MQPVWPQDGSVYIRAYQFLLDYQVIEFAPEDVIHFRDGIDPRNDRLGLATLKAELREVCTDNEVSGYTANIMRNLGVPGLVVIPAAGKQSGKFTKTEADKVKEIIRDSLGADNRGDTAVFSEQVELKVLGFSPEALRIDKLAALPVAKICASFGFSPMAVGLPDPGKTYSNYEVATSAAWRHGVVPVADLVAETLHWELLPEFDDPETHAVEWDYAHVEAMQEDLKEKHARVRDDWKAGLVTHAESCTLLGYEVDPDGDRYYPGTSSEAPEPEGPADGEPADGEEDDA
jgi:phage portal protein BeeE